MSSKEFCESGKHKYIESDIVSSVFASEINREHTWIVVQCALCDSKFLKGFDALP